MKEHQAEFLRVSETTRALEKSLNDERDERDRAKKLLSEERVAAQVK